MGDPVVGAIRCDDGELDVFVNWGSYLGREVDVSHQIGNGLPITNPWYLSTDGTSTFFPGDSAELLKLLRDADRWVIQVDPQGSSPLVATFGLDGIEDVVAAMNPTCPL